MTTGPNTHSHQVVIGGKTYTTNAKKHAHSETPDTDATAVAALTKTVAELTAKVAALTPVPVPPVEPPAADEPAWAVTDRQEMTNRGGYVNKVVTGPLTGAQLNAIIAAIASGTRIVVAPGTAIDLTGTDGINFKGKTGLELILTGCNVRLATDGTSNLGSAFFFENSHWISVRGGTVQGQNPNTGTAKAAVTTNEKKSAAAIRYGSDHIELDGITWLDLEGFGVWTNSDGGIGGTNWPSHVWVHGCTIEGGEMGIAVVSGRYLIFEDNTLLDTTWSAFDFEPDNSTEGYEHVLAQRNTINGFGWEGPLGGHTHWLLAANPASSALGAKMLDMTYRQNHIIRGHVPGGGQNAGGGGLLMRFDKANVKDGLVITDNVSDDPRTKAGSPIQGNAVRNAVITGNRQKLVGNAPLYVHGADAVDVPDVNVVAMPNVTA